jgi:hypothetical protein
VDVALGEEQVVRRGADDAGDPGVVAEDRHLRVEAGDPDRAGRLRHRPGRDREEQAADGDRKHQDDQQERLDDATDQRACLLVDGPDGSPAVPSVPFGAAGRTEIPAVTATGPCRAPAPRRP